MAGMPLYGHGSSSTSAMVSHAARRTGHGRFWAPQDIADNRNTGRQVLKITVFTPGWVRNYLVSCQGLPCLFVEILMNGL